MHVCIDSDGILWTILRFLITGNTSESKIEHSGFVYSSANPSEATSYSKALHLVVCCVGLQVSYLTWGVFQEKTITQEYVDSEGHTEKFTDSQFLVFMNRILAFIFSGVYLLFRNQNVHQTPLYKYSFCALSNILSSWCQYEALKFVSFPSQVSFNSINILKRWNKYHNFSSGISKKCQAHPCNADGQTGVKHQVQKLWIPFCGFDIFWNDSLPYGINGWWQL